MTSEATVDMGPETGFGVPASMIERMTLILDAFTDRGARLRLDQIAAHTGLPRSTSHRIAEQLVRLGWLMQTADGYALGQRAVQLGGGVSDHGELRAAAAPALSELQARSGKTAHLGILDFGEVVVLDKIGGGDAFRVPSQVGGRLACHATALGKAMLAWLPPEEVDTLLGRGLRPYTRNTITDVRILHQELRRIRGRHGLSYTCDEYVGGVSCAGVAVRCPDGTQAAISICDASSGSQLEWLAPLVLDAARRISQRLDPGFSPGDTASTVWSDGMMERILRLIDDDTLM